MTVPLRFSAAPDPQPGFARFVRGASLFALALLLSAPLAWTLGAPDTGPEVHASQVRVEPIPSSAASPTGREVDSPRGAQDERSIQAPRLRLPSPGPIFGR